jgi:hypothetical protein
MLGLRAQSSKRSYGLRKKRRPSQEGHRRNGQITLGRLLPADRSRVFRYLMGMCANLRRHGYDPKRRHPNNQDRREGDRQGACVPVVDEAFIIKV